MRENQGTEKSFNSVLKAAVPPQLLTPELRTSLEEAGAQMDQLGLIDPQRGEVYINEDHFRATLLRATSENTVGQLIHDLKTRPDQKFISAREADAKGFRPITMFDLASKAPELQTQPDFSYQSLGLTERSSEPEIINTLKQKLPNTPDAFFDDASFRRTISRVFGEPSDVIAPMGLREVMGCIGAAVPGWMIGIIFGVIMLLIGLALAGAWHFVMIAFIWLAFMGVAIVLHIINCISRFA